MTAQQWVPLEDRLDIEQAELARTDAYAATFALQEALLGAQNDDEEAIDRGLATYETLRTRQPADGQD